MHGLPLSGVFDVAVVVTQMGAFIVSGYLCTSVALHGLTVE